MRRLLRWLWPPDTVSAACLAHYEREGYRNTFEGVSWKWDALRQRRRDG